MKRPDFIFLTFLLVALATHGQDNKITEFDLYGCWTMENVIRENEPKKRTFIPCDHGQAKNTVKNTSVIFGSFNKCIFPAVIQDAICPIIYKNVEGTWTYNKKSGIVEIYYPKDFKKEFWDVVKDEYPDIEIPNQRMKTKFKIVGLVNGKLEIEKTTANTVYN